MVRKGLMPIDSGIAPIQASSSPETCHSIRAMPIPRNVQISPRSR